MKTAILVVVVAASLLQLGLTIRGQRTAGSAQDAVPSEATEECPVQPAPRYASPTVPRLQPQAAEAPAAEISAKAAEQVRNRAPEAPPKRTDEDVARELENAFATDNPPNQTSAQRLTAISQGLGNLNDKGAHLNGVDCRATRCKIGLDFSDQNADDHVMSELFSMLRSQNLDVGDLGYQVSKRDVLPDGTISATVHLFEVTHPPATL